LKVTVDRPTGKDEGLQRMKREDEEFVGILWKNNKN
jgi:hypothetical protein